MTHSDIVSHYSALTRSAQRALKFLSCHSSYGIKALLTRPDPFKVIDTRVVDALFRNGFLRKDVYTDIIDMPVPVRNFLEKH